jgi:hypothetical protein
VDPGYVSFDPWFAGGLILLAILRIASFFMPMKTVRRLMVDHAQREEARVAGLAEAIAELESSLVSRTCSYPASRSPRSVPAYRPSAVSIRAATHAAGACVK